MSIQVKCNGCDNIIDTLTEPWFESAYFDPREGEELDANGDRMLDGDLQEEQIETQRVYHFCSPICVSTWGMRLSMEKWAGPVL